MRVNEALLEAHVSHRDDALGISEEFVRLQAGSGSTLGVLALPLGDRRPVAWAVCHSFGAEQVDLHMSDVAIARALAAAGYPTLRFHCQGYGDSGLLDPSPRPSSQLRDTLDVIAQIPALTGASRIGLTGARFGGTIAALAASRGTGTVPISHLLLVQPVVNGSRFVTELLRSRVITEMFGDMPSLSTTVEDLRRELDERGMVNVKGWRLYRDVADELGSVDLLSQLGPFSGRALVIQVSRGDSVQRTLSRLQATLQRVGGTTRLEVLSHPAAANFGYEHFRPVAKDILGDILEGVNQGLTERALAWLAEEDGEVRSGR